MAVAMRIPSPRLPPEHLIILATVVALAACWATVITTVLNHH